MIALITLAWGVLCFLLGYSIARVSGARIIRGLIIMRQRDNKQHLDQLLDLQKKHIDLNDRLKQMFPPKAK
jgi:hypothetical protein